MSDETTNTPEDANPTEASADAAEKPAKAADGEKPAKAAKKEKPPALENKPFQEFISQHYLPALKQTLSKMGISDLDLQFEQLPLPIADLGTESCWQVIGHWQSGKRQFNIIFLKEDIQAPKYFTYADNGSKPTMIESFMIDERKVNLDLLLLYTVQRLNGQKWLVMN